MSSERQSYPQLLRTPPDFEVESHTKEFKKLLKEEGTIKFDNAQIIITRIDDDQMLIAHDRNGFPNYAAGFSSLDDQSFLTSVSLWDYNETFPNNTGLLVRSENKDLNDRIIVATQTVIVAPSTFSPEGEKIIVKSILNPANPDELLFGQVQGNEDFPNPNRFSEKPYPYDDTCRQEVDAVKREFRKLPNILLFLDQAS